MGDIVKYLQELIDEGRFIEEPREKYVPLPRYEDWEYDSGRTGTGKKNDVDLLGGATKGEQKEDYSNPLRRGDNSTII